MRTTIPDDDKIRAALQWAFSEQSTAHGSIFELFSGREVKEAKLVPSRRTDGLSATRVHATESQKQGSAKIPISSGRSGGEIRRAVYSLPHMQQQWVNHCYNPNRAKKMESGKVLLPGIWNLYLSDTAGIHARSKTLITFMVHLQLQQARSYAGLQKWSDSLPEAFRGVISRPSWSDTHKARWEGIHRIILTLDHKAMQGIAAEIKTNY